MQTTLRIDDALYRKAKARAASLGISLTQLFEEALRAKLRERSSPRRRRRVRLPVSSASGDLISSTKNLEELIEAADLVDDQRMVVRL
jgi:antitoxin component of RelBE/YafQ-DinJ toxin-antitoxin module